MIPFHKTQIVGKKTFKFDGIGLDIAIYLYLLTKVSMFPLYHIFTTFDEKPFTSSKVLINLASK